MAFSLLSVLKMVPWGEVISKAPEIADGAKKLWRAVAKGQTEAEVPPAHPESVLTPEAAHPLATLQAKLAATEAEVADLQQQMLQSSELIKALAEQNTQLIKRLEVSGRRILWLTGIMAVLGLVVVINLIITLAR
jgi:hypothetical protein